MSAAETPKHPGKITAFVIGDAPLVIRPAPLERDWMNATHQRFAYRCLPLNIANGHGWEMLSPSGFAAGWTGQPGLDAVVIGPDTGTTAPAVSHFGHGILTFHIPALFRTEPGYDLVVQGPINRPKDGIYPLTGVVETDWMPFSFTMNWIFTRPNVLLRFEKDEPICHIFPVKRGEIEALTPEVRALSSDPALKAEYDTWSASRNTFNADLKTPGSTAQAEKWQKVYLRGQTETGQVEAADDHRTKLRVKPFRKAK
ncbi:MAG: DUF6065 family protein [Caulobacter sp.]|nr:DUF6065 family protein [Caulobacter sp.]